jgi:hypothetical protein
VERGVIRREYVGPLGARARGEILGRLRSDAPRREGR